MLSRLEGGIAGKGIGFDYLSSVKEIADGLLLTGIVYEKSDGSIKFIAEGDDTDLEELGRKIEKGDFVHPVENFYMQWCEYTGEFQDFSIVTVK